MKNIEKLLKQANSLLDDSAYDDAEPVLLVALKYAPRHPEVQYLLGEVYCKQQRFGESIDHLLVADRLEPGNSRIMHLIGWAVFMNGDISQGREFMEKAYRIESDNIRFLCDRAVLEMRDRNFDLARDFVKKAKEIDPEDDMVLDVENAIENFMNLYNRLKPN